MKTGMKLIQGALFVLLFLFAACTPHRRPIPDEMIGEHRIPPGGRIHDTHSITNHGYWAY